MGTRFDAFDASLEPEHCENFNIYASHYFQWLTSISELKKNNKKTYRDKHWYIITKATPGQFVITFYRKTVP